MILQQKIAHLYLQCSLKNTIISIGDIEGNIFKQWSTKSLKKTDIKKNNPYNLQLITNKLNKFIFLKKINYLHIFIKGKGIGRYNIVKNLKKKKLKIFNIIDTTSIPFNGCRQKKIKRR